MSDRRATRPLNVEAVKAANAAVAGETGGRPLTMGPDDATLRKKWMDAYIAAGGKFETIEPTGKKPTDVTTTCPLASSPTLLDSGADVVVKSDTYKECPDEVKNEIKGEPFSDQEKKDLEEVLDKYKPLMKCKNQPLKAIGKTNKGISHDDDGNCYAEEDTMGEWFSDKGTLVLTDAADSGPDFPDDESKQFRATATHEIAHAIAGHGSGPGFDPRDCKEYPNNEDNPLMKEFKKAAGWNETGDTLVETDEDKAPTDYAETNADEDFAESAMLYHYDPDKLKSKSPARHKFMQDLFNGS
jgi:hypothetical protein